MYLCNIYKGKLVTVKKTKLLILKMEVGRWKMEDGRWKSILLLKKQKRLTNVAEKIINRNKICDYYLFN